MSRSILVVAFLGVATFAAVAAPATRSVTLQDHKFTPAEIRVPAGQKIELTVTNKDATPEEFDSHALRVEKVIPGGKAGVVRFGPLGVGNYPFVGEYHEDTAMGVVIAE